MVECVDVPVVLQDIHGFMVLVFDYWVVLKYQICLIIIDTQRQPIFDIQRQHVIYTDSVFHVVLRLVNAA